MYPLLQSKFYFPIYLADSKLWCVLFFCVVFFFIKHAFRFKKFNNFGVRELLEIQANKTIRTLVLGTPYALHW